MEPAVISIKLEFSYDRIPILHKQIKAESPSPVTEVPVSKNESFVFQKLNTTEITFVNMEGYFHNITRQSIFLSIVLCFTVSVHIIYSFSIIFMNCLTPITQIIK